MFLTFAYRKGQTGRLGVFILTFVFDLKVSPYLSLVCQFCSNSFMLYPNKQVNHANGLAGIWGHEVFDVTWLLEKRIGRVETLSLGGEAQSTLWSEHTISHKHLEQMPSPCLHLYLVMKELMPRCNQKLTGRVGPLSNFCGRFCDYWLYQKTPCIKIYYYTLEELMSPQSHIWNWFWEAVTRNDIASWTIIPDLERSSNYVQPEKGVLKAFCL